MPPTKKEDFKTKCERMLREYEARYDIESLSSPNDKANLDSLIRNNILIAQLQAQLNDKIDEGNIIPSELQKYNETITELTTTNIKLENQLAIDRKSRKKEQEDNPAVQWEKLKIAAREFLNDADRLVKVYCKHCNIMVGRISGVYDSNEYEAKFLCPQCNKFTKVNRKGRDVFFDLKPSDREWRKQYPAEIEHPKQSKNRDISVEDDIFIEAEEDENFGLSIDTDE